MTSAEIFDLYSENDVIVIFDEICEFFSKELPQDFIEEGGDEEIIFETLESLDKDLELSKMLKFRDIIEKHQPDFYNDRMAYIEDFFIDYHCYHLEKDNLNRCFSKFIENPVNDFDIYLTAFKKLSLYQHTDLLEKAVEENFKTVEECEELIPGAEYELALYKNNRILQDIFTSENDSFDKSQLFAQLSELGFEYEENDFSALISSLLDKQLNIDEYKVLFKENTHEARYFLNSYFRQYMLQRGFEFYLSDIIFKIIDKYWIQNFDSSNNDMESYFHIDSSSFEAYVTDEFINFISEERFSIVASIWGGVYIYDFLFDKGFISQDIFDKSIEVLRQLKAKTIIYNFRNLWRSNFVHQWQKPDCISEIEFEEEAYYIPKKLFG